MVFGEIVEPFSRAYIEDEFEEGLQTPIEWSENYKLIKELDEFIIVESKIAVDLFKSALRDNCPHFILKNSGLELHIVDNIGIATFVGVQKFKVGQIVEVLQPWLSVAKKIYTLTTESSLKQQNNFEYNQNCMESKVRNIKTDKADSFGYLKLEVPNVLTGFSANVLSYCIYNGLQCSSFIFYINCLPLDSINSKYLIEFMSKFNLFPKHHVTPFNYLSSNLYM